MGLTIENEPKVLSCPKCGAPLARGVAGCGYCRSEFTQAVGASAAESTGQVVEKDGRFAVEDISFDKKLAFSDEQLVALAGQIAVAMVDEPRGKIKHYANFSLPMMPKPGRPSALFIEAVRDDSPTIKVSLLSNYGPETHQRLQAEGQVLNLP
jgi:hypothetical protein